MLDRHRHRQLQSLLDDMQTMVAITESDDSVSFCNNTPLKVADIVLDDVLGRKLWDCKWFSHDSNARTILKKDCATAWSGQNVLRDIQISVSNGLLWVAYSIHPILNENGQVVQLLHEARDISERKKIEDEISDSEQHLKLYREQAPIATIEWSTDFQVLDWNKAAEKMFGYSLEEVKGRDFVDIMLPESAKVDVGKIWADLIAKKGGTKSINENLTKGGGIILCEWHNTPLIDSKGNVIGAASLVLDITERYKAQQELRIKENEQREILNSMVDAVITIDETGKVISFNKAAEILFGYHPDEVVGDNISRLMPELYADNHDGYLFNYLTSAKAHVIGVGREVEGLNKNNETFPMRLSVAELPSGETGLRRFIGTCQDLTKIKQQEKQIQRSQKMDALGKLTGGIAHDYNNMLGVVLGYSQLLKRELLDQPKLIGYVNEIHHAGERGAKLTKKLLSFSRKEIHESVKLNVNTLLLGQEDMLQKILTVRIKLKMDLAEDVWSVGLDDGELEDAILNMSINAMHAMAGKKLGAELTIRTCNKVLDMTDSLVLDLPEGEYVQVSVIDTGCGMTENTIEKIFDPFYSTKGDDGTGLGLSQVFGFVNRAKGAVKVYSTSGVGSRFVLYFPRYEDEENKKMQSPPAVMNLEGNEKILIVDDEMALLNLTTELLNRQGYQTFKADSALKALKVLDHESIDLMLSDIIMPEMDGYQLAIIAREKYPELKIQLVSGFSGEKNIDITNENLHENLLHKPYDAQELFRNIRGLLDKEIYLE